MLLVTVMMLLWPLRMLNLSHLLIGRSLLIQIIQMIQMIQNRLEYAGIGCYRLD